MRRQRVEEWRQRRVKEAAMRRTFDGTFGIAESNCPLPQCSTLVPLSFALPGSPSQLSKPSKCNCRVLCCLVRDRAALAHAKLEEECRRRVQ